MSHYTVLKTELRNKKNILKALSKLGYTEDKVEVHETAQNLYGYQGDKREQTAEIIIRRKYVGGAANDIGFKLQKDGTYQAEISEYDSYRHNKKWMQDLEMHYGIEQTKDVLTSNGYSWTETVDKDNNIQLLGVSYS
jgi:hypothetical protein